jgi:hypothetical protein
VGAAAGAAVGYLYFTEEGERSRRDLARFLDRAAVEMHEARGLWQRLLNIGEEYQHARRQAIESGAASLFGFGRRDGAA